jgi:hypothetical protein
LKVYRKKVAKLADCYLPPSRDIPCVSMDKPKKFTTCPTSSHLGF